MLFNTIIRTFIVKVAFPYKFVINFCYLIEINQIMAKETMNFNTLME